MKTRSSCSNKKGFTLIELLLSVAFFSFFIIFIIVGFIQINRAYGRGITVKSVQQSARSIVEDMTREMQASPATIQLGTDRLCLGSVRYVWSQWGTANDYVDTSGDIRIVKTNNNGNCADPVNENGAQTVELLSEYLQIENMTVSDTVPDLSIGGVTVDSSDVAAYTNSFKAYDISLILSTDDEGLSDTDSSVRGLNAECDQAPGSAQYCKIIRLSTTVTVRQ